MSDLFKKRCYPPLEGWPWHNEELTEFQRRKVLNDKAIEAINERISELSKESKSFFCTKNNKSLKLRKVKVLRGIVSSINDDQQLVGGFREADMYRPSRPALPNNLQRAIEVARQSSNRLDQGKYSHRTKDLLDTIVITCEAFELCIDADDDAGVLKKDNLEQLRSSQTKQAVI